MPNSRSSPGSNIVFALGCVMLLYAAWVLRSTLFLIYMGALFAMIFTPAVSEIQRIRLWRWNPNRGAAILILLTIVLGIIAAVAFLMLPPIVRDAQAFMRDLPAQLEQLSHRIGELPFGKRLASHFNPSDVTRYLDNLLQRVFSTLRSLVGGLVDLLLVAIFTAYFILDGGLSFRWAMSLVPPDQRERLRDTMLRGEARAQKWLGGQLLLMLILGLSTAVVLGLLHVRYFYALAVFAGLANFVPVVGALATVTLSGAVAALDSWMKFLGVVVFYLIYLQVENAYLTPRIMKSKVGIPAISVMVALAIGGALAGVLGALVAVPSAAIIATIADEYLVEGGE